MKHYSEIIKLLEGMDVETVKDNKKNQYINIESGFDIETTSHKIEETKVAFMYIWQFGIGYGNPVYYGRTWEEFIHLCEILRDHFELGAGKVLPVYVHNLGYEFQFMRKHFKHWDVFAVAERKPIKALALDYGIEFRDSYILSGYSLANTAKNLTKHNVIKMVGDLDYSLIRHQKTPLTAEEIGYCRNDIEIILAYINEEISHCGNVAKIPMTNTGRVRTYVRNNCYYRKADGTKAGKGQYFRYRQIMEDLTIDVPTYVQLKTAFMGGFTHANANHSGKLLENVSSIDFTSSYPAVMVSEKFPMSRFRDAENIETLQDFENYCRLYAVVFNGRFTNIRPRISQENYISESKCRNIRGAVINNGRINSAESITTTLTEIDYEIMSQCYEWDDLEIKDVKFAYKGYLPKAIIQSILNLYQNKTELKDVEGFEVEYLLSKGMLNSIYGMSVTDIIKDQSTYTDEWGVDRVDVEEEIEDYNESKNRFLYYAWGIWVTAYARRNLWTGIIAVGNDYVYSDTDSLKILNYEKHLPYIEWYDSTIISKMRAMCRELRIDEKLLNPKTKEGVEKMLGIWDFEGTYSHFKTLGAKRYLTNENGRLTLTVAGLSKQNGIAHLLEESKGDVLEVFERFTDSLYIPSSKTGKMTHTYIDDDYKFQITDYLGQVADVETLSGVHLENCDFTLSIATQYREFMQNLASGYIYKGLKHI